MLLCQGWHLCNGYITGGTVTMACMTCHPSCWVGAGKRSKGDMFYWSIYRYLWTADKDLGTLLSESGMEFNVEGSEAESFSFYLHTSPLYLSASDHSSPFQLPGLLLKSAWFPSPCQVSFYHLLVYEWIISRFFYSINPVLITGSLLKLPERSLLCLSRGNRVLLSEKTEFGKLIENVFQISREYKWVLYDFF